MAHQELVSATRGRQVLLAFDQDYHSNQAVCTQMAALIASRIQAEKTPITTRIAVWDGRAKGIDDAALARVEIRSVSITEWFKSLSSEFRDLVKERWSESKVRMLPN